MAHALPPDGLVTTEQAATILNVPASAIAKWKHRKDVIPKTLLRGRGRGGSVPLYDLEHLRPLADRYHQRRATERIDP